MDGLSRVLLVAPFGGARWVSISAYAGAIAANAGGVAFETVEAPWWNPPSLLEGARERWWREPRFARDYDVVHLTDHALGHHVRRFRARPVVVTCHDLMPFAIEGYFGSRREAVLKRAFLRHSIAGMLRADRILAVSEYTAGEIVRLHGVDRSRISVVPNMVRPVFAPVAQAETAVGVPLPAGPRILSVGHSRPYKNLELLIAALASPRLRGTSLVRVGGRLTASQLALARRLGVDRRIHELGRLPDAALAAAYSACHVLAQPSLAEGFGVPVVEAMACGLPVVTSDGGALPEVGAGAALVSPLSSGPEGLASALAGIIDSPALAEELRAKGLGRAARFRPEVVLPQLFEAYGAAMATRVQQSPGPP